ncbi:OLC1v1015765C1 [Oldenlandia corymbosa var. corymbosa]|uniref:OLC1v1015765C1 n=1 Tax=Oldenlandia corymbosa var. corymbosa TaxID=529605 RepID=A0AAV1E6V5_OLDCO|nr:OLC1v1015765C1 [Oldenlandia corymbosa var. corymbosa]
MVRRYANAGAYAARSYQALRETHIQKNLAGVRRSIIVEKLAPLEPIFVADYNLKKNMMRVEAHPLLFQKMQAIQQSKSHIEEEFETSSSLFPDWSSNVLMLVALVECGTFALGSFQKLQSIPDTSTHFLRHFAGDYTIKESIGVEHMETEMGMLRGLIEEANKVCNEGIESVSNE